MKKIKIIRFLLLITMGITVQNVLALEVGEAVPECQLKALENANKSLNIQQTSGQVHYVDFWASWCGPCAKSFPYMNKLESSFKQQGLNIVAVNLDENIEDAQLFLKKIPADFSIAIDPEQQCAKDFNIQAMPSTYLIDRKGVVRHIHLGFREGEVEELQVLIEKLLAEK